MVSYLLLSSVCCVRIALCNSGGIRAALQEGNVTLEDLMTSFPFSNTFDAVTVTGKVTTCPLQPPDD